MLLLEIIAACLIGGVLSAAAAATLGAGVMQRHAGTMVSFAVGVLLSAALLDLLPAAAESLDIQTLGATLLVGFLMFFSLEKLALWRHEHGSSDTHAYASIAIALTVGDGIHNFVDGLLLAATFTEDSRLGWSTTAAIVAHELPQELGDFVILLAAGYSRARALALNVLASLGSVLGGLLGYVALPLVAGIGPYAIAVAAASFLYIAAADLIPLLHARRQTTDFASQLPLLVGGAGLIWISTILL